MMDAVIAALITAAVSGPIAYLLGTRRVRYERLYDEQARMIAGLFERFEIVEQRFHSLVSPVDWAGEPNKREKASLAADSFNELLAYYRRNSLWLSRHTSALMSDFIERYRQTFRDFQGTDPAYPYMPDDWPEIWQRFEKKAPELRVVLEEEFRAILHPPPWYDAPLRILE